MKSLTLKKVLAMAAVCAPLFLTSCSEEDTTGLQSSISIAGGNNSQTINREENNYSIAITATGHWTAKLAEDSVTWLTIMTTEGNGNGNVEYYVEPNTGDEARQAYIILAAGNQKLTYKVTQTIASEADDIVGNNGNEIDYSLFGTTVPVGFGMHIKKSSNMKKLNGSQIFSIKNLNNAQVKEYLFGDYVSQDVRPKTDITLSTGKELSSKSEQIGANLSVNVQYGLFKLGLKGAFNMFGESTDTTFNYTANTTVPAEDVSLDYLSLVSDCDDPSIPANVLNTVFSKSFLKVRDSIQTLVENNGDNSLINKQLDILDKNFGPVFCSGATIGGNANLSIMMKKSSQDDTLKISGTLSVGFTSLFSINAEASANYLNTSRSYLENTSITIDLEGGTNSARNGLVQAFASITDPNTPTSEVHSQMLNSISSWAETINPEIPGSYTCTDYELIGIWELFTNEAAQDVVKEYFKNKYPNDEDGKSPYLVNIVQMADE